MSQAKDLVPQLGVRKPTDNYDCPECKTGPFEPHLPTCSLRPKSEQSLTAALHRTYRLNRVVNEQIGVLVSISHGMSVGAPDKDIIREAKRRLYKDARRPHPGPNGKIYRPWGKPQITLRRDMNPLDPTSIQVIAKWPKAVDLTKPAPARRQPPAINAHVPFIRTTTPYPATVCSCDPCRKADCRPDYRTTSLGKCEDMWDQECICSNTAADGDCEGCRTWLT